MKNMNKLDCNTLVDWLGLRIPLYTFYNRISLHILELYYLADQGRLNIWQDGTAQSTNVTGGFRNSVITVTTVIM